MINENRPPHLLVLSTVMKITCSFNNDYPLFTMCQALEKAVAPHSSTLAWKIPWMEDAWWAAVHGVTKSRTQLSDFTFTFHFHALEKEMATHSSGLAWENPRDRGAWWAAVYRVAQSRTRLKRLSSSSSSEYPYIILFSIIVDICWRNWVSHPVPFPSIWNDS